MSSTDLHRTTKQMWPSSNPTKSICDSIHQCNNLTKCYDDPVSQYTVDKFGNEKLVVVCSGGISSIDYSLLTYIRLSPNRSATLHLWHHSFHRRPSVDVFDLHREYFPRHPYVVRQNCRLLFVVSTQIMF